MAPGGGVWPPLELDCRSTMHTVRAVQQPPNVSKSVSSITMQISRNRKMIRKARLALFDLGVVGKLQDLHARISMRHANLEGLVCVQVSARAIIGVSLPMTRGVRQKVYKIPS